MQTGYKEYRRNDFDFENYQPAIVYDPDVASKALRPKKISEIITNPYYLKAAVRLLRVFIAFFKILLDYWYDSQKWTYLKQWIQTGSIDTAEFNRRTKRAVWLREKLLDLGPTFIKIGQALSTRPDLLRREYIIELSKLQDKVPTFDLRIVEEIIIKELGKTTSELFESFDTKPLAAASLGQVYRAKLFNKDDVVVKVQRPDLIDIFNLDIAILKKVARFCRRFLPFAKNRNWPEIVDEFGKTLFEEIDYNLEAKNINTFRQNFCEEDKIIIPKVYKEFVTRKIIVMEYKPGIKIDNIKALDEAGVDRIKLSHHCIETYLKQLLSFGIYHADPHPGNLAIDPTNSNIIFYDFGMVGRIPKETRVKMISAFLNMVNRRSDALVKDLIELNMLDKSSADLDKIKSLIEWSFSNYYDTPYEEVRFEDITDELADIMFSFPFRLPASFTFIVRSLVTLEGLSIKLNPQIKFMEVAVPFAKKYITHSDLWEVLYNSELKQIVRQMTSKITDFLGIEILSKPHNKKSTNLDLEEIIILRRQMINAFGVISMGIIILMFTTALSLFAIVFKKIFLTYLLIGGMFFFVPIYFTIILAVLLSRPKKPKDLLRRHLEQKNKFL